MPPRQPHDGAPPAHWPEEVTYLTKSRLSPTFPSTLIPLLSSSGSKTFAPKPAKHPSTVIIKRILDATHPANGQFGLFAKSKFKDNELIIPYFGVIHAALLAEGVKQEDDDEASGPSKDDPHADSDYDLSLLRVSASELRNPCPGTHVSIGIDAAGAGNAGRFVNDFRGVKPSGPNAEFRVGHGDAGDLRMEIWSLKGKGGIAKGEEILVSYGKGWWGARNS